MPAPQLPRVRLTAVPHDGVFVVRGDELDERVLAEDARRFRARFPDWGRFGISAFYAASDAEVDALCEAKLNAFPTVAVFRRDELEASGLLVVPTFRTPHVTIAHDELEELVRRLLGCGHVDLVNPYHEREED